MFNLMVCRKSYRKEWDELISKAKCEGITPYNLGKELFQDEYRKIYKKELPICRCLYEDLQEAYNELSKHSLLNELQKQMKVLQLKQILKPPVIIKLMEKSVLKSNHLL